MKNKRGQVTLFIRIGIIVVVSALLIFIFKPKIISSTRFDTQNPSAYIDACIEGKIDETLNQIYLGGGDSNPSAFVMYDSEKIGYLCYTNEYNKPCVNQQPLLKSHIKNEIDSEIRDELNTCFDSLEENYERKGYDVNLQKGILDIEIQTEKIIFDLTNYEITVTKQDTESYDSFDISMKSDLYTILSIVNNIIEEEIKIGDVNTMMYMTAFRNFKLEKNQISGGTTVYVLTNEDTQTKFQFASRSHVLSSSSSII